MADKIAQSLASNAAVERARQYGPGHARRFSWAATAAQTSAVYAMVAG